PRSRSNSIERLSLAASTHSCPCALILFFVTSGKSNGSVSPVFCVFTLFFMVSYPFLRIASREQGKSCRGGMLLLVPREAISLCRSVNGVPELANGAHCAIRT